MNQRGEQRFGGAGVVALVLVVSVIAVGGVLTAQSVVFWALLLAFAVGTLSYLTPADDLDRWLDAQALRIEFGETTSTGETTERGTDTRDPEAALQTARQRYAAGEIDEATFEALVEDLLETETVGDARERASRTIPAEAEPTVE